MKTIELFRAAAKKSGGSRVKIGPHDSIDPFDARRIVGVYDDFLIDVQRKAFDTQPPRTAKKTAFMIEAYVYANKLSAAEFKRQSRYADKRIREEATR